VVEPKQELDELLKALVKRSPALAGSAVALAAGIGLLVDDAHDFGKLGEEPDHPSPFHHWLWGVLLMLGGVAGLGFALLDLLGSTPPQTPIERLPPSIRKRALPFFR